MKHLFRNAVFLSALWHFALLGIFSFSFGPKIPKSDFSSIYSFGGILNSYNLIPASTLGGVKSAKYFRESLRINSAGSKAINEPAITSKDYSKPQVYVPAAREKLSFLSKEAGVFPLVKRREQVVVLHPQLPLNFLLFFQDRQTAHIEVAFNIVTSGDINSIVVKRRISSGNLEADLLCMRHIGHYLFLRQNRLPSDEWQTVKIDLSTKDD